MTMIIYTLLLLLGASIGRFSSTLFGPTRWVKNTQRAGNESGRYLLVKAEIDGRYQHLLLTPHEVHTGVERAESHPEDLW